MKVGNKGKLAAYLTAWALVGVILLTVPTLLAPFSPTTSTNTLTIPSSNTNGVTGGANSTITHRYVLAGSNASSPDSVKAVGIYGSSSNQTFTVQTQYPSNITIVTYGNAKVLTITSTAPANLTVTTRSSVPASNAATIGSNIPDFALRLVLLLVPAVILSGIGMIRVRRRFSRELATGD